MSIIKIRAWRAVMWPDMHLVLLSTFFEVVSHEMHTTEDALHLSNLVLAIGLYLAFGTLVNDFFDYEHDQAKGSDRLGGLPKRSAVPIAVIVFGLGLLTSSLNLDPLSFCIYVLSCVLAVAYSSPPTRLKARGVHGIWLDVLIERVLPLGMLFAYVEHFGFPEVLLLCIATLSQLETILRHQIEDHSADAQSGIRTFVLEYTPERTCRILNRYVRPAMTGVVLLFAFTSFPSVTLSLLFTGLIAFGYFFLRTMELRGRLDREDPSSPLYFKFLDLVVHSALPIVYGLLAIATFPGYALIFAFAVLTQYPNARRYQKVATAWLALVFKDRRPWWLLT